LEFRGSSTDMSVTAPIAGPTSALPSLALAPRRLDIDRAAAQDVGPATPRRSGVARDAGGPLRRIQAETTRRLRQLDRQPLPRPGPRPEPAAPRQGRAVGAAGAAAGAPPPATGTSAFLAQYLAQEVIPQSPPERSTTLRRGLDLYRDAMAQGVAVIGPADFRGLVV